MSTVTPPSPPPPPPALAALPRTIIVDAPPALTDLPSGTKLDVIVGQILDATQLKLKSPLGDITVKLSGPTNVKAGDALILQLLESGTSTRSLLSQPNGLPLTYTQKATTGIPDALQSRHPALAQTGTAIAPVVARPGGIITANLLRPIAVNGALQVIPQAPGASGTLNPGQTTSPQTTGSPSAIPTGATPAQVSLTPNVPQGAATPSTTGIPGQIFSNGSQLIVKIISVNVPSTQPPMLTPAPTGALVSLAPGQSLSGVVSGRQGIGQTVVQTHAGPISLLTSEALPLGTQIKFKIVSLTPPPPGSALHAAQVSGAAPLFDGDWRALDEALTMLRDAAPGAHTHIMQTALPRADGQLSTNVLFFLSVLRGGDMKNWMGDGPSRILERLRPELAARMRTDLNQMTQNFEDPLTGDWRLHAVPFLFGGQIDRLQLLVRDQEDEDEDNLGNNDTRFVIDLTLTELGHLQIDGLVGNKNKRLDVVLRTDTPLQPHMRENIRRLYTDALELTGLEGSVGFQAAPGNFIDIPKSSPTVNVPSGGMMI
ncbi:MAG: hypothetical protein QMB02_07280 [Rhodospirillales bacterium]